jgi:hypothetical protein
MTNLDVVVALAKPADELLHGVVNDDVPNFLDIEIGSVRIHDRSYARWSLLGEFELDCDWPALGLVQEPVGHVTIAVKGARTKAPFRFKRKAEPLLQCQGTIDQ